MIASVSFITDSLPIKWRQPGQVKKLPCARLSHGAGDPHPPNGISVYAANPFEASFTVSSIVPFTQTELERWCIISVPLMPSSLSDVCRASRMNIAPSASNFACLNSSASSGLIRLK
ncbi:hypothetical protein D3C80_1773290 [compost metagenome]